MSDRRALAIALALAPAAALAPAPAYGERDGERDPAAAETLFGEAAALMAEGKWEEACPRFEASWELDPARGALLGVAECHAVAGELASAWAAYQQLRAEAAAAGDRERSRIAKERIEDVEPRIPRLVIELEDDAERGVVEIRRGGAIVPEVQLGVRVFVDPGTHDIRARAERGEAWSRAVEIEEGETKIVTVPALARRKPEPTAARDPAPSSSVPVPPDSASRYQRSSAEAQRWLGYSAVSGGALSAAAGVGFAIRSYRQHGRYDELCPQDDCAPDDDEAGRARRHAEGASTLATAFIGVGLVAMTGGIVLWATSPSPSGSPSSPGALRLAPQVGQASAGASLSGRF